MKVLNNMVMLEVNRDQKQSVKMDGFELLMALNREQLNVNGRETNPVLAKVYLAGSKTPFLRGDYIITSHNTLTNSAMQVGQYCIIPNDRWILATVTHKGELRATPENIICERIEMPDQMHGFYLPATAIKDYSNQVKVLSGEGYNPGDVVGILKYADYEVVYNWKGEERRRIIVWKQDIICKL